MLYSLLFLIIFIKENMFFKRLDLLSPPITFYHRGYLSHPSILSGILSIVSMILILILAVYYSLEIIERKNPKIFSYTTFVEDAGIFSMNSSHLFHFLSMSSIFSNFTVDGINFQYFRIIGLQDYYESYLATKNLSAYEHWLYGLCNNNTDTQGISDMITYDFFERSACIRQYYSTEDQKYYDTNNPNFKWPVIAHGTHNPNYQIYNIVIESCKEDTVDLILGKDSHCQVADFFELNGNYSYFAVAYLYYINNFITIINYDDPKKKFFDVIEGMVNKNEYTTNHLNFDPVQIKTHNGLIFDNIEEESLHIFQRNDVFTAAKEENDIFTAYVFWLKNTMSFHERDYKRIQDAISSIGGIYQFITIVAIYINSLYNNYIVLSDTETLLNSSIHNERTISIKNEIERKRTRQKLRELKNEKINNKFFDNMNYSIEKPKNKNTKNSGIDNNLSKSNNNICPTSTDNVNSNQNHIDIKKIKNLNKYNNRAEREKDKNFCGFLFFKFLCGKKENIFNIYNEFRIKMISEEHLIKNHLNIYNLLRVTEKKRFHKRSSYKLEDVINLV